mmetsp:Transcript_55877/g.154037  ORF Transcript_55877/g.154037 Transcript_55877/m.154037 type:complete len:245 (+) Transcript_55877:518-1252(+)
MSWYSSCFNGSITSFSAENRKRANAWVEMPLLPVDGSIVARSAMHVATVTSGSHCTSRLQRRYAARLSTCVEGSFGDSSEALVSELYGSQPGGSIGFVYAAMGGSGSSSSARSARPDDDDDDMAVPRLEFPPNEVRNKLALWLTLLEAVARLTGVGSLATTDLTDPSSSSIITSISGRWRTRRRNCLNSSILSVPSLSTSTSLNKDTICSRVHPIFRDAANEMTSDSESVPLSSLSARAQSLFM